MLVYAHVRHVRLFYHHSSSFKPDVTLVYFEGPNAHLLVVELEAREPMFARATEAFSPPPTLEYAVRSSPSPASGLDIIAPKMLTGMCQSCSFINFPRLANRGVFGIVWQTTAY